jgi:hypothetical protein
VDVRMERERGEERKIGIMFLLSAIYKAKKNYLLVIFIYF